MADFLIDEGKNKIEGLNKAEINQALENKADAQAVANAFQSVNEALDGKASTQALNQAVQDINTALDDKVSKSELEQEVAEVLPEAMGNNYYNKEQTDEKVTDIKTETDVINNNIVSLLYGASLNDGNVGYKRGGVNLATGEFINPTSKKSMVDKGFEPIELKSNNIVLHVATGYKTRGAILNPDKTYNSFFGTWSTGGTVVELQNKKGYFVMLAIEKTDGTDITDLELSAANEKTLYIEADLGISNGVLGELDQKSNINEVNTNFDVVNQNILSMLYNGNLNDGNIGYKKGSVNLLTGEYISPNAKKSIVDKDFKPIELKSNNIVIHIATGYKTRGVILNPDKTYNSYFGGWSTGGTVDALQNKKGYFVMLVIERVDGEDITDQEREAANEKTLYIEAVLGLDNGILGEFNKINKPFYGKKIVNFGDSIFGNFRDDNTTTHKSISKMLEENLGATTYNAGFGGCRMSERTSGALFWNAFSMCALADSVYSENWSVQEQALIDGAGTLPEYFTDTVNMLKLIDFSEIDIVTISYGTNDFTGSTPLNGTTIEYQNYEGALKYSIRKLLSKYPSLKIVVLSPAWRFWRVDDVYAYCSDDQESENTNGDMLTDYVDLCNNVCKEYHIPYIDMYYNLGFNPYSYQAYFSEIDSTHPIQIGRQLMANRISGEIRKLLFN